MPDRFHVLTGGPGSGKSTLIGALAALGYGTTSEAGRAIIKAERAAGVPETRRRDPAAFLDLIAEYELESYLAARALPGHVFFDRGMPDVAGGYAHLGLPVPDHVVAAVAAYRYAPTVFVAPPWREIYVTDAERDHAWETAVRTYDVMVEAYTAAGYELVELPRVPVAERVAFVLAAVS